jgi:hypothetical protein
VSFRLGLSRDCLAARGNVVLQLNCGTWHAARAHGGHEAAAVSFLLCKTMRREIAHLISDDGDEMTALVFYSTN